MGRECFVQLTTVDSNWKLKFNLFPFDTNSSVKIAEWKHFVKGGVFYSSDSHDMTPPQPKYRVSFQLDDVKKYG